VFVSSSYQRIGLSVDFGVIYHFVGELVELPLIDPAKTAIIPITSKNQPCAIQKTVKIIFMFTTKLQFPMFRNNFN
jgi:hypothetical protein